MSPALFQEFAPAAGCPDLLTVSVEEAARLPHVACPSDIVVAASASLRSRLSRQARRELEDKPGMAFMSPLHSSYMRETNPDFSQAKQGSLLSQPSSGIFFADQGRPKLNDKTFMQRCCHALQLDPHAGRQVVEARAA